MRPIVTAAALGMVLLASGCASAPTHVFTLTPTPPANRVAAISVTQPIEVAEVPLPPLIDRNSIVLNAGNGQLSIPQNDEWGGPLGSLIRETLTADLQSRLGANAVLPPGSMAPKRGLRILRLTIQQFIGSTNGHVVLDASWAILKAGGSDVLQSGRATITTQATSGKTADIVQAMSRALGELADHIAARIS